MKTIAITIDEPTLQILDELAASFHQPRSRSALVRVAVREFAQRQRQRESEAQERQVLQKHKKLLARQARALIGEQALTESYYQANP
jgi:metal-responsive CopG/Arc/MetJ family transcriptional regulator